MATAMTVYDQDEVRGHNLCIAISYTSGGTANTLTIPAGHPDIDLSVAHPLIGALALLNEANTDQSDSSLMNCANEMVRGVVADSAAEMSIMSASTVSFYTTDKDGIALVSYRAGGARQY
ncbi:hypothetical protein LCGC14_2256110 [marine sediment metagenome]|uniref:Uncharacterized protein n=1 Tax=marine sediment metagenome TaxID=412755 RepID=A0A0F9FW67_9ZZZZ